MSILNCNCPLPTEIGSIGAQDCEVNLSQTQKIILQKKGYTFDGTTTDITVLADWQTLLAASDATKAQITPFIYNPVITAGEPITNGGGDNTTLNGVSELVGVNPTTVTAEFRGLPSAIQAELQAYVCFDDLVVYLVTDKRKIIAKETSSGSGEYTGFDIQEFFVGDRTSNGLNTKDTNALSFSLKDGWSQLVSVQTPAFNPLTELINP